MKTNDQQNIKLLKSFYDAVSRGDFSSAREALDSNVEWIEPEMPELWFSGTHRGAEAVWKDVIAPAIEKIHRFRVDIKKFFVVGEHVIAIGYFRGRSKLTGNNLNAPTAQVWTLRNGKALRYEVIQDPASWLETLDLANPEHQRLAA